MNSEIQIRMAQEDDCAAISDVLRRSFEEFKSLYTEEGLAATTPNPEQVSARLREGPVWVALSNAAVIGTVAAVLQGESAYVRGMAVLPSARGLGIGTRLLEELESWAVGNKVSRIVLSTTPFLDSAIRLYEKAGFRRAAEGPLDLSGTPLFRMEKLIGKR
jgi:ribosomal protein S18 acetylase RimI-like enzyme